MDLSFLITPLLDFLNTDLGQSSSHWGRIVFDFLYPANADAPSL